VFYFLVWQRHSNSSLNYIKNIQQIFGNKALHDILLIAKMQYKQFNKQLPLVASKDE
jgi:hypothetical protein